MYAIGGLVHMVPVHATVKIFDSVSISPHETMTAGSGYIMLPGLKFILLILFPFFIYI